MNLSTGTGLLMAAVVPVVVVGWAILFSVEAARRGPRWALDHLLSINGVVLAFIGLAVAVAIAVKPAWIGFASAYPLVIFWFLTAGRRRQLATVDRDIGFGEIDPVLQGHVLQRLRRGLAVVGVLALVIGAVLARIGVPQAWVIAALVPVAGWAMWRARAPRLGGQIPPSL